MSRGRGRNGPRSGSSDDPSFDSRNFFLEQMELLRESFAEAAEHILSKKGRRDCILWVLMVDDGKAVATSSQFPLNLADYSLEDDSLNFEQFYEGERRAIIDALNQVFQQASRRKLVMTDTNFSVMMLDGNYNGISDSTFFNLSEYIMHKA